MNSIFNDFSDKNIFVSFLNKLNIVYNKITVLNLLYGNKKQAFLNVQDVSEYKKLEVAWCALPSAALISIGSPTFGLIFALDPAIDPVVTLKVIGHQWYWSYEYDVTLTVAYDSPEYQYSDRARYVRAFREYWMPHLFSNNIFDGVLNTKVPTELDYEEFLFNLTKMKPVVHYSIAFDSVMISTEDLIIGTKRLLEVSRPVVLPVSVPIKTLITSADVLHSWAIPSLGIKIDAVPGRINQFVMEIKQPGYYYGQCSELCGTMHGYMPITLHVVYQDDFINWVKKTGQIV